MHTLLAALAAALFVTFIGTHALRPTTRLSWRLPALASLVFLGFSVHAVTSEGMLGFWPEHVHGAWGNQIWFDLLLAASIGWVTLVPRALRVGMQPWPWALALCLTGSIGLLAMLSRVLYLEDRAHIA